MTVTSREPHDAPPVVPAAALAAAGVLVACWWAVGRGLSVVEAHAFRAVNELPDAIGIVLWPTMQLGTRAVWLVAPLVVLATTRRARDATVVLLATVLAWSGAALIKAVVARPRPAGLVEVVTVRGDVADGAGFVSAHSAIAFALAVAVLPIVPRSLRGSVLALAVGVAVGRMFVGAHLPLDVLGGAALGVGVALAVRRVAARAPRRAAFVD